MCANFDTDFYHKINVSSFFFIFFYKTHTWLNNITHTINYISLQGLSPFIYTHTHTIYTLFYTKWPVILIIISIIICNTANSLIHHLLCSSISAQSFKIISLYPLCLCVPSPGWQFFKTLTTILQSSYQTNTNPNPLGNIANFFFFSYVFVYFMVLCIECALSGGYHNVTSMRVIHAYRIYVFFLQAHILLCLLMMMAYHYFTFSFSLSHLTKKNKRFAHIYKR